MVQLLDSSTGLATIFFGLSLASFSFRVTKQSPNLGYGLVSKSTLYWVLIGNLQQRSLTLKLNLKAIRITTCIGISQHHICNTKGLQ